MTLIDFPSIVILVVLMASTLGHRQVIGFSAVMLGLAFQTIAGADNASTIMLHAVIVLKLAAFPALAPYHVLKNESFPTILRMTGCGIASLFGKCGAVLAPALFEYLAVHPDAIEPLPDHAGYHHGNSPGGGAGSHSHRTHKADYGRRGRQLLAVVSRLHKDHSKHESWMGSFYASGELAGMGPDFNQVSTEVPRSFLIIAGLVAYSVAASMLLLEETKGRQLPDLSEDTDSKSSKGGSASHSQPDSGLGSRRSSFSEGPKSPA